MKAKILWVEGKRANNPSFVAGLRRKGYEIDTVPTGSEAFARLTAGYDPDLIVVNAASMRTTGKRICQSLQERANGVPILLITEPNQEVAKKKYADVVLSLPFTIRKLLNRIKPLLPGDERKMLQVGEIRLDMERKRVKCQEHEATLTPRLALLLKTFMEHPGEVLERERLFRRVWNTEYTGDTRTLDVHISWLRQAIEENPHTPKFLKTIRSVGYRLDI